MPLESSLRLTAQFEPSSTVRFNGWRYLHKAEGGNQQNPWGMPEVGPPENASAIKMTKEIQEMSFELMAHFNPLITPLLWTRVHDHDRAFTNFNGFGNPDDPRANYILGENLSANLPKYDKAQRVSGGQFIRGEVEGDQLVCTPGLHGIDANSPLPDLGTIISNNWYLFAISLNGENQGVSHFPQGQGGPVAIPFIFAESIRFPLWWFEKWEADELPDPLRIYR